MFVQMNVMETIQKRYSVRTYAPQKVEENIKKKLRQFFTEYSPGPLGAAVRFKLLELVTVSPRELRSFGTYGMIRGAGLYILAAVEDAAGSQLDLGYCLEKVVLEATALGLGTCWLGGTFRRSRFARWMELAGDELLPVIIPVGYPAEKKRLSEAILPSGSTGRRKPWPELFFTGDAKTPLSEEEAGPYRSALEAVRLAPSALNGQPWRIIKDGEGCYRLYLKENRLYNRTLGKLRLQHIDMGIAMAHFELVAREQALPGRWDPHAPALPHSGLEQVALWDTGSS